jgi:hypothetical protein
MQFGQFGFRGAMVAVLATASLTLALTACGGGSAPTSTSTPPPAASAAPAPAAAAIPVPTCPGASATIVPNGPCNWSKASWDEYLADLGVGSMSHDECLADQVARQVDFTTADAVAKAFPPGTSGTETDYINKLIAGGMDPTDAQVDVASVVAAKEVAQCSS